MAASRSWTTSCTHSATCRTKSSASSSSSWMARAAAALASGSRQACVTLTPSFLHSARAVATASTVSLPLLCASATRSCSWTRASEPRSNPSFQRASCTATASLRCSSSATSFISSCCHQLSASMIASSCSCLLAPVSNKSVIRASMASIAKSVRVMCCRLAASVTAVRMSSALRFSLSTMASTAPDAVCFASLSASKGFASNLTCPKNSSQPPLRYSLTTTTIILARVVARYS
mmetsp:Transcript_16009/g.48176  ORF Transcript_16009/g.48176 Transcript_16009/m.48176 type:complete len:234 (+) Transcript_16009:3643-4344(+)